MMGTEMRLRRPLKMKDQVYFADAPRRWVKWGSYRNGSGAGISEITACGADSST